MNVQPRNHRDGEGKQPENGSGKASDHLRNIPVAARNSSSGYGVERIVMEGNVLSPSMAVVDPARARD